MVASKTHASPSPSTQLSPVMLDYESAHHAQRRPVRQLSSVKAWCQTSGMQLDSESPLDICSYESFPDLHRMLYKECAEIERSELEARAILEARIRRRNSDALSDMGSDSSSSGSPPPARSSDYGSPSGIMGSLYRLINPIIPGLAAGSSAAKDSAPPPHA
ncbi:hypothetical protein LPJ64_005184 [Coemansia asiatica]|uniref:Uncharacterized protein n=1 Tax=Coemansia asiatica TaxID=1052880 RepID=A0A9W8CIA7_9FUNG|nr:hypothetical protein LPJ64_005184 [Coemansia asiatica]KAJ2866164.1 hypothetical protein FB639_005045 [Coemansia asiatica]